MRIEDFIPSGHEHAVSREYLVSITGTSDREIRQAISKSKELIINDGKGYFIYDPETDVNELRHYALKEVSRSKSQKEKVDEIFRKAGEINGASLI